MDGATYSPGNLHQTLSGHRKKSQRYRAERGHSAMEPYNHYRCQWPTVSRRNKVVPGGFSHWLQCLKPVIPKLGAAKVVTFVAGLHALGVWCRVRSVPRNFIMEKYCLEELLANRIRSHASQ